MFVKFETRFENDANFLNDSAVPSLENGKSDLY